MMQAIIFILIDNTINDPKYNFPVAIGYKGSYNNESDKFYVKWFNKIYSSHNKFNFYCKITKKHVKLSIYSIAMVIDAIKK